MTEMSFASAAGEMGERIRAFDWSATPLGTPTEWPSSLKTTLALCLGSPFPMAIYWGPELRLLYNDGWAPIPGPRHPDALGRPAREVWPDIWSIVGPQFGEVMATGRAYATSEEMLPMARFGRLEESYWDYSFTPIADEDGRIAGILNQGQEVTARVHARRRDTLMLELGERTRDVDDPDSVVRAALAMLGPELDVARAGYAEIDSEAGIFRIVDAWRRDEGVADLVGVHPLGAFGDDLHQAMRTGAVFGVDDAQVDRRVVGQPAAAAYAAAGIRAGLVVPVLSGGRYAAALFVHDDRPRYWTLHHERMVGAIAERVWHERARSIAAVALRESEQRHRLIFEQANDIVFTADLDQVITGANPSAGQALGVDPRDLIGRSVGEFVSPAEFARTSAMLSRKLRDGGTTRYEVTVNAGGGRRLRWEINSTLSTGADGRPIGLHAIARDVSDRHRHEEEQRRLIDELNHRVKNMLAQVQGLAQQSFRGGRPVVEAQQAFQGRLSALAAAYDLLTREKWSSATLDEVVAGGITGLGGERARIAHSGPLVLLQPKTAVSLLMALHELAINARDHGALSEADGRVTIVWRVEGERLLIDWRESGGPATVEPERRGFGLRLIERALAADLSARVSLAFTPGGLTCAIDAPLAATCEQEPA